MEKKTEQTDKQSSTSFYIPSQAIMPGVIKQQHLLPSPVRFGDIYYGDNGNFKSVAIGTTGQVLTVVGGVPAWATGGGGGSGIWGQITGTLSDQTDLQNALNAKQATLVSTANIKSINGSTILGSGDLTTPQGTVTAVSVATANGISGSSSGGATPILTLSLGAITPSTVNGLTLTALATGFTVSGGTISKTLTVPLDASVAGTNTGDQTLSSLGAQAQLNGTGFVKASGTSISYDNSTYLTSVTAHNILSTTHGDTLADTVVRGDILYGNSTPKWARLAFPATPTGKVLQATATDIAWSTNPLTIGASASVSGSNTGDQNLSGYELLSNKATTFGTVNDTLYPSVKAVNDAIASAVVGLLDYRGSYDASTNLFPATGGSGTLGAILKGDFWIVSVAGTLGGTAVTAGDLVIALQDTPAQTASNWDLIEHDLNYVPENVTNKVTSISGSSTDTQYPSAKLVYDQLAGKQATLVSATNIKSINGSSILASGDLTLLTSLSGAVLTDQTSGQTIGATGARLTKLWATDITITNAVTGSVTGNAGTVTNGVYTNAANSMSLINPLTTIAESWIGPSNTNGIYFKGGYVGIGQTSPTYKLEVVNAAPDQARFASSGANRGSITIDNIAGGQQCSIVFSDANTQKWEIGKQTDNSFYFYDNANSKNALAIGSGNLYLEPASGKVGIGTYSPATTLDVMGDVTFNNYKAIAMVCDNGATLPSTPSTGQWFLHTPTGRNILYIYNGTGWTALTSIGTMTLYVDTANGTNDTAHGTGTGTNAFQTIQYACDIIPVIFTGNVTINIAPGTYTENVVLRSKKPNGNVGITFTGTLHQVTTGTATGGTTGGTTSLPTVTGTGWTASAWANKLIKFTSGTNNGQYRIVDDNSTTVITTAGNVLPTAPANNDTFTIYDWGTGTDGVIIAGQFVCDAYVSPVNFYYIKFSNSTIMLQVSNFSNAQINYCWLYGTGGLGLAVLNSAIFTSVNSLFSTNNAACDLVYGTTSVSTTFYGTKFLGVGKATSTGIGVRLFSNSGAAISNGCIIDGHYYGIWDHLSGISQCWTANLCNVIRNCVYGIQADSHGQVLYTGSNVHVVYSGNTNNTNAEAASYSYIGA